MLTSALERWPSPVEGDGLENRYGSLAHREFKSLPLRQPLSCAHTGAMRMDWSIGHYETTAEQLNPVSVAVVERASLSPGERVVDVGCGTGNAALLAALRGAHVTGVDPAAR